MREDDDGIGLRAAVGLGVLVLAAFVAVTTELAPVGLLPQLVRDYGVSTSLVGLLVTVYAALVAVLAVPLTRVTAALPRKPLLVATLVLYTVGNLLIAVAPDFAVVCAGRALGGVAHALFFSVTIAYASAVVPARLQGRAIAIAMSGASLGFVLGVPLVTSIGAAVDQRVAFGALAVGGLLVAITVGGVLPPIATPPPRLGRDAVGPRADLAAVAGVNVLAFFAHYVLYTYVSSVLIGSGLPEQALGTVLFLLGAAGVVGLWLAGLLIDRRPRAGFLATLALGAVCVALLLGLRGSTAGAIAATAAWGVAFGAVPTFCAAASLRVRVLTPDLSAAVNNAASNVGIGAGAAIGGGVVALGGVGAAIPVSAAGFALSFVLVVLLRRGFPRLPPTHRPDHDR